jgi:hypothetical protein
VTLEADRSGVSVPEPDLTAMRLGLPPGSFL